ncbi:hypothetical protein [Thermaerobacter subterraneus]|uniref:Uncharacterized protein n=1 Tax=Thermaerobacter subterraneus DSM 13965 TaxID=867903 RepID=K6PZ36_9FIRM|nr:hypothetical protein [Thermaerobacter subterraneus]EKP93998.1 hypothetical protein ThesuDRAFT_01722 [Thermaerobacter subterraneus DSM 13965]
MTWLTAGLHAAGGLLALVFAGEVGRSFLRRRAPSSLCWFVALMLFAASALADAVASLAGWSPWLYRLWYVGAAWLVAAFGAGTAYLVFRRAWAHAILVVLAVIGMAMLVAAIRTPVDLAALSGGGPVGGEGWADPGVRAYSPLLTIPGALLLLGGAVASWWRARHPYALWLLAGTLVLSSGGALTRFGVPAVLPVANLIGVWMLYRGHRLSREAHRAHRDEPAAGGPARGLA